MNIPLIISLLPGLLLLGSCQQDETCSVSKGGRIQIGSKVNICLKIKTHSQTFVYAFGIAVDKLSALQITDVGSVINQSSIVSLSFEYLNIATQQEIVLQNETLGVYRNLVSLVLQSSNGVLTKVHHDVQDCSSCQLNDHQLCVDSQCFSQGDLTMADKLLVYVSWLGTDLAGQHFVSHTLRLKKLHRFAQQNIYTAALALVQ